MATRISIPSLPENNLIRNNCFGEKLNFYRFSGSGSAQVMPGPPAFCRITDGTLFHAFDIDNQEHADPASIFPWKGKFVFKFRARGQGKLRAAVRWRLSFFRNDTDFTEKSTEIPELEENFKEYLLEGFVEDFHASVNDRIYFHISEGFADITGITLFYPAPTPGVTFDVPHIVVQPGEEFSFKCSGAEELLVSYGHSSNELEPRIIPNEEGTITLPFQATGGEGMRITGIGKDANCRNSLFISSPRPALAKRMRQCRFPHQARHLLFFGDSLTAYDAGRNYTDIMGAFLPQNWSYTNAGIGGDDLTRLARRLQGRPRTYRLEHFEHIWEKMPHEIFLFYGANDSKATSKSSYKMTVTTPEDQKKHLESISEVFRQKAPEARVTLIAAAPGFFPCALERCSMLQQTGVPHTLFGVPEHVRRFNRIAKRFASEKGWGYLDFYRICRNSHDLQSLFIPSDGVHMTLAGHQLLATALLEYLAQSER